MRFIYCVLLILCPAVSFGYGSGTLTNPTQPDRAYFKATCSNGSGNVACQSGVPSPNYRIYRNKGAACSAGCGALRPNAAPWTSIGTSVTSACGGSGGVNMGSGGCKNKNGVFDGTCNITMFCCPEGQEWNDSEQMCITVCDEDETWDLDHDMCVPECEPPQELSHVTHECEGCLSGQHFDEELDFCVVNCPAGQEADPFDPLNVSKCDVPKCSDQPGTHPVAPLGWDSSVTFYICVSDDPEDENTCDPNINPVGYVGQLPVCDEEWSECESDGGTVGMVNGDQVCIPEDSEVAAPPTIPHCTSSEILTKTASTGEWSCETLEPSPPDVPSEEPPCADTDNDDICNKDDDDIDDDGTPNSEDNDDDGDGVDDDDDGDPSGNGDGGPDSSVSGGGNCETRPECEGDPIQCAILWQGWATRCETRLSGTISCDAEPACTGSEWQCAIELQNWRDSCAFGEGAELHEELEGIAEETGTPGDLDEGDTPLDDLLGDVFSIAPSTASCPADYSLSLHGGSYSFSWQPACDLAENIRPVVVMFFGFYSFRTIMGSL